VICTQSYICIWAGSDPRAWFYTPAIYHETKTRARLYLLLNQVKFEIEIRIPTPMAMVISISLSTRVLYQIRVSPRTDNDGVSESLPPVLFPNAAILEPQGNFSASFTFSGKRTLGSMCRFSPRLTVASLSRNDNLSLFSPVVLWNWNGEVRCALGFEPVVAAAAPSQSVHDFPVTYRNCPYCALL
jgi:hypothetical protein